MKGKGSRQKGSAGEREVAKILSKEFGFEVERNLNQTRDGGADILSVKPLSIEVKRQETLKVPEWWRQTVRSAHFYGLIPVLFYRRNREEWQIITTMIFANSSEWADGHADLYQSPVRLDLTQFVEIYRRLWLFNNSIRKGF